MGVAVQAEPFFQVVAPLVMQFLKRTEEMGILFHRPETALFFPLSYQLRNTGRRLSFKNKIKIQLQVAAFG